MATSEIDICNIALGLVGSDAIRSFNTDNVRSSTCKLFYETDVQSLLAEYDWSFARRFALLNKLNNPPVPAGWVGWALPSDCLVARSLDKNPSKKTWEIYGNILATPDTCQDTRELRYTASDAPVALYTPGFIQLLAYSIAAKLAMPLAQSKDMARLYMGTRDSIKDEMWESDANIGNVFKDPNNDPVLDTFVNPEGSFVYGVTDSRYKGL